MTSTISSSITALLLIALAGPLFADEKGGDRGDDAPDDRKDCPVEVQAALPDGFVASIVDADDTQAMPIKCLPATGAADNCNYLSSKNKSCDMTGLFAPLSIKTYTTIGGVVSCTDAGGVVKCNIVSEKKDAAESRVSQAFQACPDLLRAELDHSASSGSLPDNFVAYIIDADSTQSRPIQCFPLTHAAGDCDYLSSGSNSCDMSGLFAPQSMDVFDGSLVSCTDAGGVVSCDSVELKTD